MKKYIGGYSILDLASTTIYADALGVLKQNKPVLVYDDPEAYFADTIKLVNDDVVITKGGKTITINDVNAVSSEGEIANHLYSLCIKFDFQIDSDNNNECFINIKYASNTITINELLNLLNGGEVIYDNGVDQLYVVEPKTNDEIFLRIFDNGSWSSESTNSLNTTTISDLVVKSYSQIY